jgi:hypothetical protein
VKSYRVIRPHVGDKDYAAGDIRQANPVDVKHLVPHVLEEIDDEAKAEPAHLDKAEKRSRNK